MSVINYKVKPNSVDLTIGVSEVTKDHVKIKVEDVGKFTPILEPAGSVGSKILSGILWPIAESVVLLITYVMIKEKIEDQTFNVPVGETIGYKFDVDGVAIEVDAADLKLSGHDGMLMAAGTVTVS